MITLTPQRKSLLAALLIGAALTSSAQYAPPPPPAPFQGFINEWLRQDHPYMEQWDFGGNLRTRYEIKDNIAISGKPGSVDFRDHGADVDNAYLMERLRFHAGYHETWWGVYVEGRGSFVEGDERFAYTNSPVVPGTATRKGDGPESDTIDLQQAYATLGNLKEFPVSLKVGRQELIYGEERLVGVVGWNNIGRVFDAAKLRWQSPWFGADFFVSRPVIPEDNRFNVDNDYEYFSGIYANTPLIPKHSLDVYFLSRNASGQAVAAEPSPQFPQPSARDIYTLGFRVKSNPGELAGFDYTVEAAGQLGNFRDARAGAPTHRLDQRAWMAVAQGGYTFEQAWGKPRFGIEYAHASGDSDPHDNKHETFDNLYPSNHKFYGYMDLLSLQNIHDVRAIFQLKPHPRVSLALEGHGFWLADTHDSFYGANGVARGGTAATPGTGYGVNPTYDSFVGTELDAIAGVAVTRFAQVEVGYGHFFVGNYIQSSLSASTRGSTDANWVYLQATVSF
jgi:hypothetical protein